MSNHPVPFRHQFLPYLVRRLHAEAPHKYVILNRQYKPLGLPSVSHTPYYDYNLFAVLIPRFVPVTQRAISWDNQTFEEGGGCIYLYNDGCLPDRTPEDWAAYAKRLERLNRLHVAPVNSFLVVYK